MSAREEIQATYTRYIDGYSRHLWACLTEDVTLDLAALQFWSFPLLHLTGGAPRFYRREEFEQRMLSRYVEYGSAGWTGGVRLTSCIASPVSAELAVLVGRGSRHRADGTVIDEWSSHYLMHRRDDRWMAMALAPADASAPSTDAWSRWLAHFASVPTAREPRPG